MYLNTHECIQGIYFLTQVNTNMNAKDVKAIKDQEQLIHACNCSKKTNKPTSFVCVKCGKCYHKASITKNNAIYHLVGNLICCCENQTDYKYFEQEIATLTIEKLL